MLVATFGPTTGWAGKTITREGETFILQDHGPISVQDVMTYDGQGHLIWATDGTRAWVASLGRANPLPVSQSGEVGAAVLLGERAGRPARGEVLRVVGLVIVGCIAAISVLAALISVGAGGGVSGLLFWMLVLVGLIALGAWLAYPLVKRK